ncbi:helicase associated domain-containing protein [Streptomyces massasporeus]|uniref:helicase associated domain-containing protein n=1 Tax=Streptomyces massasporeus TaxID=67324 RepID=UPI0036CF7B8E
MIWDPAEEAWRENLAATRAYHAQTGTLAAPVTATALDKPVGQWPANCRKSGGLGKDEEKAKRRAEQLAEIDPDWRPDWPVDWQRTYAGLARLLAPGATRDEILPGITAGGMDVGRWLQRQRQHVVWEGLAPGQPPPTRRRAPFTAARSSVSPTVRPGLPRRSARAVVVRHRGGCLSGPGQQHPQAVVRWAARLGGMRDQGPHLGTLALVMTASRASSHPQEEESVVALTTVVATFNLEG